ESFVQSTARAAESAKATNPVPATAGEAATVAGAAKVDSSARGTANGARAEAATATNGVARCMPPYGHIPPRTPRRLKMPDFDFMSQKAGDAEKSADDEYPQDDLERHGQEAQRLVQDLHKYWPWHGVDDAFGEQRATEEEKKEPAEQKMPIPKWVEKA